MSAISTPHSFPVSYSASEWLSDKKAAVVLAVWKRRLGVRQNVHLERISPWQVTNEHGNAGCSLVGIVYDEETATIYHSRRVRLDDIVHELLHAAHPNWSEFQVVQETERIVEAQSSRTVSFSSAVCR